MLAILTVPLDTSNMEWVVLVPVIAVWAVIIFAIWFELTERQVVPLCERM